MGNERRHSKDQKGSRRSSIISPGKETFVSAPITIKNASYFCELGRNPKIRTQSEDGSAMYDEEGFSRTDIAMAMAGEQIYEHGAAIQSTLDDRLSESNSSRSEKSVIGIPAHLDHSKWASPPTSPTFSMSPLVPVSPLSEANRITYLETILKNLDVAHLVKSDKDFHDLMWDLKGIRQWWTAKRLEWIKNREKLHASQVTLNSLITQIKAAESSKSWEQHLRLKNACIQQRKEVLYRESWFPEIKYLLKLAEKQFRRVQKEAQKRTAVISQRVVVRKWVAPDGFSFGISPPGDMDMYKTHWFTRQGFRWWLVIASSHLEHCIEQYRLQKDSRREGLERVEDEIVQLAEALEDLERLMENDVYYAREYLDEPLPIEGPAPSDNWRTQLANLGQGEDKRAMERKRDILAKQAVLNQLKFNRHEHDFLIKRAALLTERDNSILNLVRSVLSNTENNKESLLLSSMDFSRALHYLCSVQGLSAQLQADIDLIFNDDGLQDSDKVKIMNSSEFHPGAKKSRQHHELLIQTLDKAVVFQSDLKDVKNGILHQFGVLTKTLEFAETLYRSREMGDLRRSSYPGRGSLLLTTSSPPIPAQQASTWGNVKTYEQAVSILTHGSHNQYQDPGWYLRAFFVSPDIAPHFLRIEKITRDKFLELVNSFPQKDFSVDEIEPFLKYCTFVGDLFIMSGDTISTYKDGWELMDEMPIDPTPRAVEFAKPPDLDDMFSWLVRNKEKYNLVSAERKTTEAQLLYIIRMNYSRDELFSMQKLRAILGWFDNSGLLYRYTDRKNRNGEIIIRRIDNGWGPIDINQGYDAIFDPNRPPTYFQALRSIIKREEVQTALRDAKEAGPINTEWEVYNLLKPYFKIKRLSGLGNIFMTRHRFHLYLRWCDQIGDGMDLRRDGRIVGGLR